MLRPKEGHNVQAVTADSGEKSENRLCRVTGTTAICYHGNKGLIGHSLEAAWLLRLTIPCNGAISILE